MPKNSTKFSKLCMVRLNDLWLFWVFGPDGVCQVQIFLSLSILLEIDLLIALEFFEWLSLSGWVCLDLFFNHGFACAFAWLVAKKMQGKK